MNNFCHPSSSLFIVLWICVTDWNIQILITKSRKSLQNVQQFSILLILILLQSQLQILPKTTITHHSITAIAAEQSNGCKNVNVLFWFDSTKTSCCIILRSGCFETFMHAIHYLCRSDLKVTNKLLLIGTNLSYFWTLHYFNSCKNVKLVLVFAKT